MNGKPIIAVNTIAFHGCDWDDAFRAIAEIGVEYVEPLLIGRYNPDFSDAYFTAENAGRLRRKIADYGLNVLAVSAHMNLGESGAYERFLKRMKFARSLGAGIIHTNSALKSRRKEFLKTLERLITPAETLEMTIALENPGDGAGNLMANGAEGADLVRSIGSEHIGLNYDPANAYAYSNGKIDLDQDFRSAISWAAHLHLKQIQVTKSGNWLFTGIENGVIDYCGLFAGHRSQLESISMSLELPLKFVRDTDGTVKPGQSAPPESIAEITTIVEKSVKFVSDLFQTGGGG